MKQNQELKPLKDLKPYTKCWAIFDEFPPWPAVICETETTTKLRDFYSNPDGIGVLCLGDENEYALIEPDKVFDYTTYFDMFKNGDGVQPGIEKMKGEIVMTQIEFVDDSEDEDVKKDEEKKSKKSEEKKKPAEETKKDTEDVKKPAEEAQSKETRPEDVKKSAEEKKSEETKPEDVKPEEAKKEEEKVEESVKRVKTEETVDHSESVTVETQKESSTTQNDTAKENTDNSQDKVETKDEITKSEETQTEEVATESVKSEETKTEELTEAAETTTQTEEVKEATDETKKEDTEDLLCANLSHILATYPRETDLIEPTLKLLSDQVTHSKDVLKNVVLVSSREFESDPLDIKQKIKDMGLLKLAENQ